jgi:hypothetical protein
MGRTLLEKIGFKPGTSGWVRDRPPALTNALPLPDVCPEHHPGVILSFVAQQEQVAPALAAVLPHYARGKALWFAYPKKSGSIRSDLTRDRGWDPLLAADLLPVTQVAIDDDWSALRFRYRDEIAKLTRRSDTHQPGQR